MKDMQISIQPSHSDAIRREARGHGAERRRWLRVRAGGGESSHEAGGVPTGLRPRLRGAIQTDGGAPRREKVSNLNRQSFWTLGTGMARFMRQLRGIDNVPPAEYPWQSGQKLSAGG